MHCFINDLSLILCTPCVIGHYANVFFCCYLCYEILVEIKQYTCINFWQYKHDIIHVVLEGISDV